MSHGSRARPGPVARPPGRGRSLPGQSARCLGRLSWQLALILAGPLLAGLILAAPVLAIVSLGSHILAASLPALATVPAARGAPSSVLCSGYRACARHGFASYGYGTRRRRSYWRMPAGDDSTNYVAYVESAFFNASTPRYLLGDAGQWPRTAAAHGVPVNDVPSVGSVAEWSGRAFGTGHDGHVAIVEKVGPHDSYILVSQQHLRSAADGYDWTRINAGFPRDRWQSWPSHFLHFPIRHR